MDASRGWAHRDRDTPPASAKKPGMTTRARARKGRLLVVRNDKLGDFCLAWPVFSLLRHYLPDHRLCALVPDYTAALARLHPAIDEVVSDRAATGLATTFANGHYDALLTLFSTRRVALAGWRAGIPYRLAPATRWWQLLYNRRLTQRRSRSEQPEYAYNLDLGYQLLYDHGVVAAPVTCSDRGNGDFLPPELPRPLLSLSDERLQQSHAQFLARHQIAAGGRLIFVHPGSGGSANNLSLTQYGELIEGIAGQVNGALTFVISAGPGEAAAAQVLRQRLAALPVVLLGEVDGLGGLVEQLALADLFISNSTGPLHLAGLLDRPTAAFYPRHRSGSPLRWQTLNAPERRLVFTPPEGAEPKDVSAIDVDAAAATIARYLSD